MFASSHGKGMPVRELARRIYGSVNEDPDPESEMGVLNRALGFNPDTSYLKHGHWMERMQLMSMADALSLSDMFVSVMAADEFPTYLMKYENTKPMGLRCAIVNTDRSRNGGSHWIAGFWNRGETELEALVVDPRSSMDLCNDLIELMEKAGIHPDTLAAEFQTDGWRCGYYSLFIIWYVVIQCKSSTKLKDIPVIRMLATFPSVVWSTLTSQEHWRGGDPVRVPEEVQKSWTE
jgi:hypothetical protein